VRRRTEPTDGNPEERLCPQMTGEITLMCNMNEISTLLLNFYMIRNSHKTVTIQAWNTWRSETSIQNCSGTWTIKKSPPSKKQVVFPPQRMSTPVPGAVA